MPRCDQCRFFFAYPPAPHPDQMIINGDEIKGGGECRRVPPLPVEGDTLADFPKVWSSCWCGQFEAAEPSAR